MKCKATKDMYYGCRIKEGGGIDWKKGTVVDKAHKMEVDDSER